MTKKRVVYIVSQVQKSLAFEWISEGLMSRFALSFVLLNPSGSSLEDYLVKHNIPFKRIVYRSKKDFIPAFFRTLICLIRTRPHVVHAHLMEAQLLGLTTAWLVGVKKRIYTRHTSTYHYMYARQGIKFDRLSNVLATKIVSISQATDHALIKLENVNREKVVSIPHGFRFDDFLNPDKSRVEKVRIRWGIASDGPCVGVIARHIEWKGIQYVIPAFKQFLSSHPDAQLVLANASGPFHEQVLGLLESIPRHNYVLIPFEEDIASLYQLMDIFIHVPVDECCEAFGQTYVEALASGIPSIFTRSGIAAEFIVDGRNALVVPFRNSAAIYETMLTLWADTNLQKNLAENGKRDVISRFHINRMLDSLSALYGS